MKPSFKLLALASVALSFAQLPTARAAWEPTRPVEFIIPAGTGMLVMAADDVVIEVGRYTLGLRVEGTEVTDVGKYLVVFARQGDGSLRFRYDAFNSDAPA